MVTVPIYTRMLRTEQYGTVSLFLSWEALASVLCTLNLSAGGFNNGMRDYGGDRDGYLSAVLGLTATLTALWAAVCLPLSGSLEGVLGMGGSLQALLLLDTLSSATLSLWSSRQRFEYRYRVLVVVTLLNTLLVGFLPAGAVALAPTDRGAWAKIVAQVAAGLFVSAPVFAASARRGRRMFDLGVWRTALAFNLPLVPHYLSTMALSQSDRLMIGSMVGASEAGVYSVAYSLGMGLSVLVTSINNSLAPWLYERMGKGDSEGIARACMPLFAIAAGALLLLVAAAPEIVLVLGGEAYAAAADVVPPIACSLYFTLVYQVVANVEFYFGRNVFVAAASVCAALLNVGMNALGIPAFGWRFAGWSTLVCYAVFAAAHWAFYRRVAGEELCGAELFDGRATLAIGAALVIGACGLLSLYGHAPVRYALLAAALVACLVNRGRVVSAFDLAKGE